MCRPLRLYTAVSADLAVCLIQMTTVPGHFLRNAPSLIIIVRGMIVDHQDFQREFFHLSGKGLIDCLKQCLHRCTKGLLLKSCIFLSLSAASVFEIFQHDLLLYSISASVFTPESANAYM